MNKRDFLNLNVGDIVAYKGRRAKVLAINESYGLARIQYLDTKRQVIKNYRKIKAIKSL